MNDDNDNPVARSNVIPPLHKPAEPSFHAFCFARPADGASGSFVIAGSGEAGDGPAGYPERTVRWGETSPDAMREKAVFVLGRMEERMAALGKTWADTTATQVYTVHDLHSHMEDEIVRRGARSARADLALRASAGRGPGVRDRLPVRAGGAPRTRLKGVNVSLQVSKLLLWLPSWRAEARHPRLC